MKNIIKKWENLNKDEKNDVGLITEMVVLNNKLFQLLSDEYKKNKGFILDILVKCPTFYSNVPKDFKSDPMFLVDVLNLKSVDIGYSEMKKELRSDRNLGLAILKRFPNYYIHLGESLKNDKDFLIDTIVENSNVFGNLPISFKSDKEFILKFSDILKKKAIQSKYLTCNFSTQEFYGYKVIDLRQICNSIMKDSDFILKIVHHCLLIPPIPCEYMNDRKFVLDAIKKDGKLLYPQHPLWGDKEIAKIMLTYNPKLIICAHHTIRHHKDLVIAAISNDSSLLGLIGGQIEFDFDIVMIAVKRDGNSLQFASTALRDNPYIVSEAILNDPNSFKYAGKNSKKNREFVKFVVKKNGRLLGYANSCFFDDREIIMDAVGNNGVSLEYASDTLSSDIDIVNLGLSNNWRTIKFANHKFRKDKELMKNILNDFNILELMEFIDCDLLNERDFIASVINNCPNIILYVNESLQKDKQLALASVRTNWVLLGQIHPSHEFDLDIILAAIKNNQKATRFLPKYMLKYKDVHLCLNGMSDLSNDKLEILKTIYFIFK